MEVDPELATILCVSRFKEDFDIQPSSQQGKQTAGQVGMIHCMFWLGLHVSNLSYIEHYG